MADSLLIMVNDTKKEEMRSPCGLSHLSWIISSTSYQELEFTLFAPFTLALLAC